MPSLKDLQKEIRPYAEALVSATEAAGYRITLTSVKRSREAQARLYKRYLQGLSRFPAAPPGTSKHEVGRAFDVSASPEVLKLMGAAWKWLGGRWGGDFRKSDPIHFEA